jgi:thioredoxin reductase
MEFDTIIVGAGPAGLQLGYFLQKGGHSYCILERAAAAASFFDHYPHSGKLISINKKNTGSDSYDFNLRHDWNSLLNDEKMSFTSYSDEYYPAKEDLVRYMNDFAARFKLNIQYQRNVTAIFKEGGEGSVATGYTLHGTNSSGAIEIYKCKKLVMATGVSVPNLPQFIDDTKLKPRHYADYPKDFFRKAENLGAFRNKSVLIIGNGNSAYELGNILTPISSHVAIYGRRFKDWASVTHYTGDVRSVYMPFIDTFLLKSLNGINWVDGIFGIEQATPSSPYHVYYICSPSCSIKHEIYSLDGFDHVIFATGWKFDDSPFKFHVPISNGGKYPVIDENYQSRGNENLFFIGALMHSHDYKKSSGGFIHGFRYLIEYFYHIQYDKKMDIDIFQKSDISSLVQHISYKINYTSPMYQMYGQLGDIFYYDNTKKEFVYFNNVPKSFVMTFMNRFPSKTFFRLQLEYGEHPIKKIKELGVRTTKNPANAQLLRPVLSVFKSRPRNLTEKGSGAFVLEFIETVHFDEDTFAIFTDEVAYNTRFARTIKGYM